MELVVFNFSGDVRTEFLHGKEYLVAPMTMIVPGVLNGSKGPLLYPVEELSKNPHDWNHMPIVVNHPSKDGKPVSARDPEILSKTGIGMVFRTKVDGTLGAEGWYDVEATKRVDNRIFMALKTRRAIELSTGLYTENEPSVGTFNGKEYQFVARNYRPDHLAVLPDTTGACSLKDGCGVLANEDKKKTILSKISELLFGGSQEEPPDTQNKEAPMPKKEDIDFIVANCDCYDEKDRDTLNTLTDEKVKKIRSGIEKAKNAEEVANAAKKGFEHGDVGFTFNEQTKSFDAKPKEKEKPVENKDEKKPATMKEFLDSAPPEFRTVVQNMIKNEDDQKTALIAKIVANKKTTFTKEKLTGKSIDDLKDIVSCLPVENTPNQTSFMGAATPLEDPTENESDREILGIPTINWAEESKKKTA